MKAMEFVVIIKTYEIRLFHVTPFSVQQITDHITWLGETDSRRAPSSYLPSCFLRDAVVKSCS